MGTRAAFFIGDPCDIANREWLGCVAWDGYPDGDMKVLASCTSEESFRSTLSKVFESRDDVTDPAEQDFPFPWVGDLFLTDYTYYYADGKVIVVQFHGQPVPMTDLERMTEEEKDSLRRDVMPSNIPAPRNHGKDKGKDSIMLIHLC